MTVEPATINVLVEGDPMNPNEYDLIAQSTSMRDGKVPPGDGWNILAGGHAYNHWARIVYRHTIDGEKEGDQ